jgi:hypothetical protein
VADNTGVTSSRPDQWFLRRIAYANAIKKGPDGTSITAKAFREKGNPLSLTLQDDPLRSLTGLKAYQKHWQLRPSGDLPGICTVSRRQLIEEVRPPLPPRYVVDVGDHVYGHLHHEIDPPDQDQQDLLAKIATSNGLLLPFCRGIRSS